MPETIAAPAPAAASTPAPASSPAPAPSSAPAASPAPAAPATPSFGGNSGVTSHVDPAKFGNTQAYAKAVLDEQLGAVPAVADAPPAEAADVTTEVAAPETTETTPESTVEVPAPDAVTEEKPAEVTEPDFELEPAGIVTPEALTQMVTDNPEFGKLLEADSRLKGQLYKTAREAAELKPYKELVPDLESLKTVVSEATTFNDVRETFMKSTTMEGTLETLARLAELSYERDEKGNVLYRDDKPVIGDDLHGFLDNVAKIEINDKLSQNDPFNRAAIEERFKANQYHLKPGISQEEVNIAWAVDNALLGFIDHLTGDVTEPSATAELPPHLQKIKEDLDQQKKDLDARQHGEKVGARTKFETGMRTVAEERLVSGISSIMTSVKKQGGVISPYLEKILPNAIAKKVIEKISANPALQSQMSALQRLPMSDDAKTRRLAAIDRAYQMYLPDVAREELRAAGVQLISGQAAKLAKVDEQAANTQKTEPRGSRTAVAQRSGEPMEPQAAYDFAQKEWEKANPGKRFDKVAEMRILDRVVQLQLPH